MRTVCIAMAVGLQALPLHGLAQSAPAPAAGSGAIIVPPATDPGMVKKAPRNVDPGAVSKPPAGVDPEMIQKPGQMPEEKPGAPDQPSRSAPGDGTATPGTGDRQPHPGMGQNGKREKHGLPEEECRGRPEPCAPHAAPYRK